MPYTPREEAVLKKYKILLPDGNPRTVDLRNATVAGGQPPGPGPLMSPDAINRLIGADKSKDQGWLDWIFFQAGGGEKAKVQTADALKQIRDRFIDERTNGWTHPETGVFQPAVPREQAEARWVAAEPRFREVLAVCDQDAVKRLRTFGYYRDWPGEQSRYAHVVQAITEFQDIYKKLLVMNREAERTGGETFPSTPEMISTWEQMNDITKKVHRYFASKKARSDIRIAGDQPVYEDDVLRVIVPLTYAAAVHYGYDIWPWANRKNFEQVLAGTEDPNSWRYQNLDVWKQKTGAGSLIVYISFKVPTPAWVARRDGNWETKDLTDLGLELNKQNARVNPDAWTVYDQENRNTLTIGQVKQMILDEPTRHVEAPEEQETPIGRGPNVYSSKEDAERVVNSLNHALEAIQRWLLKFDPKEIKSDVFHL